MQTTYHDGQEAVNPQPQPGYYAIIPAAVRYCPDLPPAAKLLFGELVALTTTRGYCFAQNPYFQDLYRVDRATVKRWLAALQKQGFIAVEYDPATNERRIFCNAMMPSFGTPKPGGGGAKMSHPWRKNEPQSITESITKRSSTTLNVRKGSASPPAVDGEGAASPRRSLASERKQRLAEVVELTGDAGSSRRFQQLYEIADKAGLLSEWVKAVDALRMALKRARRPVEAPGAYFGTILARALAENGVAVPVGTPAEREEVRSLIALSLGGGVPLVAPETQETNPAATP